MRRGPLVEAAAQKSPTVRAAALSALTVAATLLVGCSGDDGATPPEDPTASTVPEPSAAALDELFVAVDATRAAPTGRYTTKSPRRSTSGAYDSTGVSIQSDLRPEIRVSGSQVFLPATIFPKANAETTWLTVPLDNLAPLENRSPGLADEVAALAGAAPPGVGPSLAALRTATEASRYDDGTLRAQLDLSNLTEVNPRDQDAVVAWAGLWARDGGSRRVTVEVTLSADGLLQQAVFDPDAKLGDAPTPDDAPELVAGPLTLEFVDLGSPVTVTTPFATDTTPLK